MFFSNSFICYSENKNEYESHVNAPLFKRTFTLTKLSSAKLSICVGGFYRAFLNGAEITKGRFAPYISNTDDAVYYDEYSVEEYLHVGENELTVLLGNGFQNPIGGEVWWLDKAAWRSAPKLAVALLLDGKLIFEADERFLVAPSPITFDDLWSGEHYDARLESASRKWCEARKTTPPKGEMRLASFSPVVVKREVKPIAIVPYQNGYVYDFGINTAGICRLNIQGERGQKISLYHFEMFANGAIFKENISFGKRTKENYWQRDEYICKDGKNIYEPSFTYHGFRYVYAEGLTEEQATNDALTMLILSTRAKQKLEFSCSDKRLECLVECVLNSNYSNFLYFPTDCPQREKNGWTGDAMLSAEQMLLSMDVKTLLKEWLFSIRKAQREDGALPRIVPCGEWAYASGESGPNWDGVLVELPYRVYELEQDESVLFDNLPSIKKYLRYLDEKRMENGLLGFGLGDREETFSSESSAHETPNYITDTLTAISLCEKTVQMAKVVKDTGVEEFASRLKKELTADFKKNCVDKNCRVQPYTQTGQCLALYAGIFTETEKETALKGLLDLLKENGGKPRMGMIGYRYLFDVLAKYGEAELAYQTLISEEYTGYLYYIKAGMTSMIESFVEFEKDGSYMRKDGGKVPSLNHHWYGHILASLVKYIAGLRVDVYEKRGVEIAPTFIKNLDYISVKTEIMGKPISVAWKRQGKEIVLTVESTLSYVVPTANRCVRMNRVDEWKTEYYWIK